MEGIERMEVKGEEEVGERVGMEVGEGMGGGGK